MNRDPNPYIHQKPLTFPAADREFQREAAANLEMQQTRVSPVTFVKAGSPPGRDVPDSVVKYQPAPHIVPMASSEFESGYENGQKILVAEKTHDLPEVVQYRYFFSLRTVIEILSVLAAMIPMVVAPHWGAYNRGFHCNDPNIMYPYRDGTVKPWILYLVCLTTPFITVIVGEYCRFFVSKTGYGGMEAKYRMWKDGPVIPPLMVSIARIFLLFAYGFLIVKSVTDIAKYTVGRLRPHFWAVCQPNMTLIEAEGGCGRYIMNAHCTTENFTEHNYQYRLRDMRLSFLSGHAAMAFYSMFFVIFYLESRLRWMQLRYCKAIIQFGLFLFAALTGMSRISDHKHHWDDVFAGAVLGLVVVIITVFIIGDFFNDSRFLRYKIVSMLQKLDWSNDEGTQFARLLSRENGHDPSVLRKLKHITRYPSPKVS